MTSAEPMPGRIEAPFISPTAQRMYDRLPRVYRVMDVAQRWQLKRYLAGVMSPMADLDEVIERLRGTRPVGPAMPEPWDLDPDDLTRWREARRNINSALTDPDLADPAWLPYLAQLVGAYLDPGASLAERRDIIRFATSGYRGGTTAALADAARSALTGSRYVLVQPGLRGDGVAGTVWDVTLRTRTSETPDPAAVLATVVRKGAKPAGVRLWHAAFGGSWDTWEARTPTWDEWEARTWDQLEETSATYVVPENMAPNASFESNVASYSGVAEGGGSVPTWTWLPTGGVDGVAAGRLAKVGATGGMRLRSTVIADARILPGREYVLAASIKPSVSVPVSLVVDWQNNSGGSLGSTTVAMGALTAAAWNRSNMISRHTSPAGAARAVLNIVYTGTVAAGVSIDHDAMLFRLVSTSGG